MKKRELEQEGKKWVAEGIITNEQLNKILQRKQQDNPNYIIILFAVLLTGLGFLTFIMSAWARQAHFSRVILIIAVIFFLYILGDILHRKRNELFGISFIVLGYIVFGAGFLLVIDIYHVSIYSAWPFLIWGLIGLILYYIYHHPLLFSVAIFVTTAGQIYNGAAFSEFNWLLLLLFFLGFSYFIYMEKRRLYSYLFAIGYTIQMLVMLTCVFEQYYWFIVLMLPLYLISSLLRSETERTPIKLVSLVSIFIFGMYQTFALQDSWFYKEIQFEVSFIIVWLALIISGIVWKLRKNQKEELIDFILFLPIMFLPLSYLIGIIVLFLFSLGWIFIGNYKDNPRSVLLGTVAFLAITFTVYIQYAWDALDRSLFFFIGGILLFVISFYIEKQRRKLVNESTGSEKE